MVKESRRYYHPSIHTMEANGSELIEQTQSEVKGEIFFLFTSFQRNIQPIYYVLT